MRAPTSLGDALDPLAAFKRRYERRFERIAIAVQIELILRALEAARRLQNLQKIERPPLNLDILK